MTDEDWKNARITYVTTDTSYAILAKKYGIARGTLGKRAVAEQWRDKKKKYIENMLSKTVNKIAAKNANKLSTLVESADNICDVIQNTLKDKGQFNKYLVSEKCGDVTETVEKTFTKIDTKAIRDMTTAIKDMTAVIRNLHDIPTQAEAQAQQIAAERFKLEKKKAETDTIDTTITVKFEGNLDDYSE